MAKRTTESDVGFLSTLVTELYKRKAQRIIEQLDDGMDASIAIDYKFLQAMGKWVLDNGVYAAPDTETEDSPLRARLEAIRAKSGKTVVDFKKEAAERGQG